METGALPIRATGLYRATIGLELFGFLVWSMFATKPAILAELKFARSSSLVFSCCVVSLFALSTAKRNDISHKFASFCLKSVESDGCQAHIRPSEILILFNN